MCEYTTKSLSRVQLFAALRTVARQAPLAMGFSRKEFSGVGCHFLLQGIFPTQGSAPCIVRQILYH